MKMIMTTVAALAISCSALQANEDVNSGKSIYSGCKNAAMDNDKDKFTQAICVAEIKTVLTLSSELKPGFICMPYGATLVNALQIVVRGMEILPTEYLSGDFALIAASILGTEWKCATNKDGKVNKR